MAKKVNSVVLKSDVEKAKDSSKAFTEETAFYAIRAAKAREELRRFVDDNNARRIFSESIFTVTVIWMFFVLMVVIACGQKALTLSDTVLVTLITTTTANVFGFLYVVFNYLFNKDKST